MPVKTSLKISRYYDSVSLMLAARELLKLPGIHDAAIVMATEANKGILREAGLLTPEVEAATPNDLAIAVCGELDALDAALSEAERLLQKKGEIAEGGVDYRPKTIRAARRTAPQTNVAVISVAGRYAADEAWDALHSGLHVLLFSDNVSIEDEIALKRYAVDHGLLMMGPGAGTAFINGAALGFANVLPRGPVGIVSAAGTGLQEVGTLLAKSGVGITQGIGAGGRDLSETVGGLMMFAGLEALQADPDTAVIVLVSKPPADLIAQKVLNQAARSPKPTVICLLGAPSAALPNPPFRTSATLEQAAREAALLAGAVSFLGAGDPENTRRQADRLRSRLMPEQRYLRGLFSGGTLCYEAQVIWKQTLDGPVWSNAPLNDRLKMPDSTHSQGHCAVDLGEEEFTIGRPHPMIDNSLRVRRLIQEAQDPETAVIIFDVVLGYGAHPDPAAELGAAVRQAKEKRANRGGEVAFIASITGTEGDPQRLSRQTAALEAVGVIVCPSNAAAARLAAEVV